MALAALLAALLLQLPSDPPRQIAWQRSLEDALALARADQRPLLVAVNMDGESACERIVRERYVDPDFVALTRRFSCLMGSVFRHAPRDRDRHGRRIECPRLGGVTCGEHVAIEPAAWERWLGEQRIAPRHALILPDGEKAFDLFLLFDLGALDRALEEAQSLAPPPSRASSGALPRTRDLATLVRARDERSRDALEALLATTPDEPEHSLGREALARIGAEGDRESFDALAVLLLRERALWAGGRRPLAEWEQAVRALELVPEATALVRDALGAPAADVLDPALGPDAELLASLARLAGDVPAQRSLLSSYLAFGSATPQGDERSQARAGLVERLGWERVLPALGACTSDELGARLQRLARHVREDAALAEPVSDALPTEAELEAELARLDDELARAPADPALARSAGLSALGLARRRAERGDASTALLVEDAERWLARAFAADAQDLEVALARARAAWLGGRFADQEARAEEALAAAQARADTPTGSAEAEHGRVEALRWLGDACARQLATRAGGDFAAETAGIARGGEALLAVVESAYAEPADWQSVASFFGALGRWREEAALARLGLERFPDDQPLHQALTRGTHAAGEPARAAELADEVAWAHPRSATAHWFAGLAHVLLADWMRRGEAPERALLEYGRASAGFELARELEPAFADSCAHYLALATLGRGFAHLLADRRELAADALREALRLRPAIADVRDALDREALDLVDGALEWRPSGASQVDALALARELDGLAPQGARWSRAVADAELREALRSLGRGDEQLGQAQLELAVQAGRIALEHEDVPESRHALAQPLAIRAELALDEKRPADAREPLAEACALLAIDGPASDSPEDLREAARRARELLGDARPIARPGR